MALFYYDATSRNIYFFVFEIHFLLLCDPSSIAEEEQQFVSIIV